MLREQAGTVTSAARAPNSSGPGGSRPPVQDPASSQPGV